MTKLRELLRGGASHEALAEQPRAKGLDEFLTLYRVSPRWPDRLAARLPRSMDIEIGRELQGGSARTVSVGGIR